MSGWLELTLGLSEDDAFLAARAIDWATGGDRQALGLPAPASFDPARARRVAVLGELVSERWGCAEAEDDLLRLWRLTCELVVAARAAQGEETCDCYGYTSSGEVWDPHPKAAHAPVESEPLVVFAARELQAASVARVAAR